MKEIWGRMTRRDRAAMYVLAPMLLLVLVWVVFCTFLMFWINGARLASHGVPTTGTVTWTGGRSQVRYTWTVNGEKFDSQDGTGHVMYSVGDQIALRYLPESPSVAHFDWEKLKWRGEIGFPVSFAMWLAACLLLIAKLRRNGDSSKLPRQASNVQREN